MLHDTNATALSRRSFLISTGAFSVAVAFGTRLYTATAAADSSLTGSLGVEVVPGPPALLSFVTGGQAQTIVTGSSPAAVTVLVADGFSNPISGPRCLTGRADRCA